MTKLLVTFYFVVVSLITWSQSFDWAEDGYISGSGGGKYFDIDGTGIDLEITGLVNDGFLRGAFCTGIFNLAAGKEIHTYTFIFSEKVDLKFTISDINGGHGNCGFIDYLGFSGNPIFSSARSVTIIDDTLVTPVENGMVTVEYYSIDTLIIKHGEGVKCNPGFVLFSSLKINQNVQRTTYENQSVKDSVTFQNLLFDTDVSSLNSFHIEQLEKIIVLLSENSTYKIKVCGHTDNVGDDAYNLSLSENRVQSVHEYLLSKGISPARIEIVFFGESDPDALNNTNKGRQKNRRVELQLYRR